MTDRSAEPRRAVPMKKPHGNATHGRSSTRLFRIWTGIRTRCNNPNCAAYPHYGARGIKIHPSWDNSFSEFANYIGEPPSKKHSVERIRNDMGYQPGNVRWATGKEQCRNTRRNIWLQWQGRDITVAEAAEIANIPYTAMYWRLVTAKWPIEEAMTTASGSIKPTFRPRAGGSPR